jgi:hypothetical protein
LTSQRYCHVYDEVSTNIGYPSAMMTSAKSIDRGDRFPAAVIEQAAWISVRFPPSLRIYGGVSSGIGRSGPSIPPETCKTNQRGLYDYRVYLEGHEELEVDTIDEHLRALARMSLHFRHRPFEKIHDPRLSVGR